MFVRNTVLALLLIAVSGFTAHAADVGGDYIFILGGRGNPYWNVMADGIKQGAADKGMNAIVYSIFAI